VWTSVWLQKVYSSDVQGGILVIEMSLFQGGAYNAGGLISGSVTVGSLASVSSMLSAIPQS